MVGIILYNIFMLGNLVMTRAVWDILSIILLTIIGVTFFNEKLNIKHLIGLVCAIMALLFVNYDDIKKIIY